MAQVQREKVTGVKFFDDSIDGKRIDSGTVFIEEPLDFTKGRAKGYATTGYQMGSAEAARKLIATCEFPVVADVEFVRVTNGDTSKNIVMSVKPVGIVKESPKQAHAA